LGHSFWVALFLFQVGSTDSKAAGHEGVSGFAFVPKRSSCIPARHRLAVELSNEVDRFTFAPAPCAEVGARPGSQD